MSRGDKNQKLEKECVQIKASLGEELDSSERVDSQNHEWKEINSRLKDAMYVKMDISEDSRNIYMVYLCEA